MTFSPILCAAAAPWSKNGEKSKYVGFMVCAQTFLPTVTPPHYKDILIICSFSTSLHIHLYINSTFWLRAGPEKTKTSPPPSQYMES